MKVLIFSHESDIDGLGNIVLAKLAFENMDYILCPDTETLGTKFLSMYKAGTLYEYDMIYITDLTLYSPNIELVQSDKVLSKKVLIFDHHETALALGVDKYEFSTIKIHDKTGRPCCGTELFYNYLSIHHFIKPTNMLAEFVELTRLEDTWEWKKKGLLGIKAHRLATFLNIVGIDSYIEKMFDKVTSKDLTFDFSKEELILLEKKEKEYQKTLENFWNDREYFFDEYNNHYVALYANYQYRNEIAEYARTFNNERPVQYIVIVALDKGRYGQKSYRSIENGFDVETICVRHGGGGHKEAASVNITKEQYEKSRGMEKRDALKFLVESSYKK